MDLKEMALKGGDWIDLGVGGEKWQSVVYNMMNLWLTWNFFTGSLFQKVAP
jgi:hypothetical protein